MLGRLKMSVDDCIEAYLSLSDKVFQKKRGKLSLVGKIQGRFDSAELEQAIKRVVKGQRLEENALLQDDLDAPCKVYVSLFDLLVFD